MIAEDQAQYSWSILGHSNIKKFLQSCISQSTVGQAYLFTGQRHVGKYRTALYAAKSILCTENKKKPCNTCPNCEQIEKNVHADVDIITRSSDKKNISIQQIRQLQHKLSLRSFLSSHKIAIIDRAGDLTEEASNALLKTLEEPAGKTVFFIIAESKELLLPTIVSRCLQLQFNVLPTHQIENWLISRGSIASDARILARLANGKPGIAINALNDSTLVEQRNERINLLLSIIKSNLNTRFNAVLSIVSKKNESSVQQIDEVLKDWISIFRDMYLARSQLSQIVNITKIGNVRQLASEFTNKRILRSIDSISRSRALLSQSVNPRIILEHLVLSI